MAKFLSRQTIYRILARELPDDVFPDGQPSAYFHTADMDSIADIVCTGYANLQRIYDNYFPQYTDEFIDKWIDKMFVGVSFDTSVTLQEKRDRVIAKIRKQPTITLWEVLKIVASYVPPGKYVGISEYSCANSFWTFDVSKFGVNTMLGFDHTFADLNVNSADWCDFVANRGWKLSESHLDVSTIFDQVGYLDVIEPQIAAFGYEIRIFDYAVTGTSYTQMVKTIDEAEPARSVHFIKQNLNLSDYGLINTVTNVDQFSLVNVITIDPSSTTGYSGITP